MSLNKRDIKNIAILRRFLNQEIDEPTAMSLLKLEKSTQDANNKYIISLIKTMKAQDASQCVKEEEDRRLEQSKRVLNILYLKAKNNMPKCLRESSQWCLDDLDKFMEKLNLCPTLDEYHAFITHFDNEKRIADIKVLCEAEETTHGQESNTSET